jgi:SAM-dependent methyltransferase
MTGARDHVAAIVRRRTRPAQSWPAAAHRWWDALSGPLARVDGVELLDDPAIDDATRLRALRDVERANAYFGGTRLVLRALWNALGDGVREATVLDVGTGTGDIPMHARASARRRDMRLTVIGLDISPVLARAARDAGSLAACGNALSLPIADRSVDVAVCSQLLHHFRDDDAIVVLRELDRVARRRVIVCDLRRSWIAAAGFWLSSLPLRFHAVSRHDGLVSVLRAFSAAELSELVDDAVRVAASVRRALGFRLIASWEPSGRDR